jgi:hypothetical protein
MARELKGWARPRPLRVAFLIEEGEHGTTTRRPRCARLVGARRRPRHRQPLAFVAIWSLLAPRALLGLALRRLPGIYRRGIARGRGDRMARLRSGRRSHKQDQLNSNGIPRFLDFFSRGTGSSNPSPSTGESEANFASLRTLLLRSRLCRPDRWRHQIWIARPRLFRVAS